MNAKTLFAKFINPMPEDTPVQHDPNAPLLVSDIIAPPAIEVDFDHLKMGDRFVRTLFIAGYPRFVSANWLEPLISFYHTLDTAIFFYPPKSDKNI